MASKYILSGIIELATLPLLMHYFIMVTGQIILFTVTFNVTKELGSYNSFIRDLRQHLPSGTYAGGVPILNPEQNGHNQYFHIALMSDNNQITIRIRNGDLVAFQVANGQWYEFQPEQNNPRLFPHMVLLPYTARYPIDGSLAQTIVGRNQFSSKINSLVIYSPNMDFNNSQRLLISLMVMFPEALKFTVQNFVNERMHNPKKINFQIGTKIVTIVHNWGSLSMQTRRSDLFGSFHVSTNLTISSAPDAASLLDLMLWSSITPITLQFNTNMAHDMISKGRQLVEIFWVQILNIDNENPGHLYGKIQVVDGLATTQYIFNRSKGNYLTIRPMDYVPLTGPTRAISAFDSFYIDVSLMDYDTISWDDEVSRGQITWNYFSVNIYDQPLWEEVKGKYGSIAVSYAVYSNAVTATVQVKLINGDNENPASICGVISSSNTLSSGFIELFNTKYGHFVDVKPLELIPLLRSVVVVPLTSSIKVFANLWHHEWLSIYTVDPIAQGSITFEAATSLCSTGRIRGRYGEVDVMVTWSSSWG